MLCAKINTQLLLDEWEESQSQKPKLQPLEETDSLVDALRKGFTEFQWRTRTPELKAKMKAKQRNQYLKHKSKRDAANRKWAIKNRRLSLEIKKRWRDRNKEKCRASAIEAYYRRKPIFESQEWKDKHNDYVFRRRKTDVQYCIAYRLRASMHQAIRRQFGKKAFKTMQVLGCTVKELKRHLESQFTNGMSWENRRSFVIDHFVPCKAFDLTNPDEQRWCFNYRNLRPMSHHDNQVKSDTLPDPLPDWLPVEIQQRIKDRHESYMVDNQ